MLYPYETAKGRQKRTIKTFANAKSEELKRLYEEFRTYIDTKYKYQTAKRVAM